MSEPLNLERTVTAEFSHQRVDHIAVQLFPEYSRSKLQNWIVSGELTIDGEMRKSKEKRSYRPAIRVPSEVSKKLSHDMAPLQGILVEL